MGGLFDKINYLEELEKRQKKSKIYSTHQMTGLIIARILEDEKHKSLYIKLAKEYEERDILSLAKDIAERKNVENKGAYFMRMLKGLPKSKPQSPISNS